MEHGGLESTLPQLSIWRRLAHRIRTGEFVPTGLTSHPAVTPLREKGSLL